MSVRYHATARLANLEDMPVEVSVVASVKDWRAIFQALKSSPDLLGTVPNQFCRDIQRLLEQFEDRVSLWSSQE